MLEIAEKDVFETVKFFNDLVLVTRLEDHNLVLCSLYMIRGICSLLKYMVRESCN